MTTPANMPAKCPLFKHQNGQYAKKVAGKLVYFGTDLEAALRKYEGPPTSLQACIAKYVASRQLLHQSGEMSLQHLKDIERTLAGLACTIGPATLAELGSEDYGLWRAHVATTNGPTALGNHITRVKAFLNWAKREGIIAGIPGDSLKKPSRSQLRKARGDKGSLMWSPNEIRRLLISGGPILRAMILCALNCGLGNSDLALLRTTNIKGSWLVYPRNKTGIPRRVPLWPETQAALAAVIRPGDPVVFRTKQGNDWLPKCKTTGSGSPISQKFTKLCRGVGVYKKGRGFYSLRHCCQTLGEESGDAAAIQAILGHCPDSNDMAAVYRERMSDKRLFKVAKYIRLKLKIGKYNVNPLGNPPLPVLPVVFPIVDVSQPA